MKILKSKGFFIKSFLFYVILTTFLAIISWTMFEPYAYNFMVKYFSATKVGSDDIVIVAIDDKSISYHRWPWPREYYGKMIDYMFTYSNPQVVGFDSIIQSSDKNYPGSDEKFYNYIKNKDKLVVGFSALDEPAFDENRTIEYNKRFHNRFLSNIELPANYYDSNKYKGISEYPEKYFNSVKNVGSTNVLTNSHGYLRDITQILFVDKHSYPYLSLKMYMLMNNTDKVVVSNNKIYIPKTNLAIPGELGGRGFSNSLKYYKLIGDTEYSHKKYSASDIIRSYENLKQGKKPIIDPKEFNGKIVLIGANAKAAALGLEDALPTPISQKHPGVDIQATNLDNIMHEEFMHSIPFSQKFLLLLGISLATFLLITKFSFLISLFSSFALYGAYGTLAAICYRNNFAVDVITPLVIQIVTMVFGYSYRFILEGKNKEKIKQAMGKYLSQDIMQNVVQNIDDIKLGGKRAIVTVLFADIRGFTKMSENMTAEEVSKILNEYFTEIEPIITKYNGVINKFIGDAVMAIFGEPIQDINHPKNAVLCANEMLKKVEELREKWLFEGKPRIEIGVGINTGEAFVGNIGSEKRLEYTVIGDTVNLASRIESYNKVYHTNFLISSSTYSHVSHIANVIRISEVSIRGKSKKMDIYEILKLIGE